MTDYNARTIERFTGKFERSSGCWPWTAALDRGGYGVFWDGTYLDSGRQRFVSAHRIAFELEYGPIPDGKVIDHTCHNRACVNPEHLRAVTDKQNNENLAGATRRSRSGVRGVTWDAYLGRWKVSVGHNRRVVHGGYFYDLEAATAAAVDLRNRLHSHNDADRIPIG